MNHLLALHDTGLTPSGIPITLFIETSFIHERAERHFWPSSRFGRELQYDPEHDALFIHLGSDHVTPIGKEEDKNSSQKLFYTVKTRPLLWHEVRLFSISPKK